MVQSGVVGRPADVRFGSEADICSAKAHVRFTPESDRKSRHGPPRQPKGDAAGAGLAAGRASPVGNQRKKESLGCCKGCSRSVKNQIFGSQ